MEAVVRIDKHSFLKDDQIGIGPQNLGFEKINTVLFPVGLALHRIKLELYGIDIMPGQAGDSTWKSK